MFLELREKESVSTNYSIISVRYYKDGVLLNHGRELYDNNNNEICSQFYDLTTNEPLYEDTEKNLYDENNEKILRFEYNENGTLKCVWGDLVLDNADYNVETIYLEDIPSYFPDLLSNNPYYTNANLLPFP